MAKYALTYKESRTPEMISKAVKTAIDLCYSGYSSARGVSKLLAATAYSSVFKVPEYLLEDGKQYSVEDICSYQKGIVHNVGLHDFLSRVGEFHYTTCDFKYVYEIIIDPVLPEVLQFLEQPIFDTYGALCAAYCLHVDKNVQYQQIVGIMNTTKGNKYQQCYNIIAELNNK